MMFLFWGSASGQITRGHNDFLAFYAGARLAGTNQLYNAERTAEVQLAEADATAPVLRLTRPPFYALILSPLGRLKYRTAYLVWVLLNAAALVGFVAVWGETDRLVLATACCCSVPIAASVANAQDVPFLLALLAIAMRLYRWNSHLLAGLVLSLCTVKYNLLVMVPLVLLAQGLRKMMLGAALGALALIGLSFPAAGSGWPADYWRILNHPIVLNDVGKMPNLNGLTTTLGLGQPVLILLSGAVAVGCWFAARRTEFRTAFAVALLGSLLVSYHSYLADVALLIPALLILAEQGHVQRCLALALLTPVPWFLLLRGGWTANITRVALILTLITCIWSVVRNLPALNRTASGPVAAGSL